MLSPVDTRPMARQAVRGLTLIEMLVTVTVLGLLLLAVAPSAAEWMRSTQVRNAAESITNGLQKALAEAVRRNQNVLFSLVSHASDNPGLLDGNCALSATSASWVVSLASPQGRCNVAPSESTAPQIIEKHAQGDGSAQVQVAVKALDTSTNTCTTATSQTQVKFDSLGRPTSDVTPLRCLEITHSGGTATRMQLRIDGAGSVRSCLPDLPTGIDDPRRC